MLRERHYEKIRGVVKETALITKGTTIRLCNASQARFAKYSAFRVTNLMAEIKILSTRVRVRFFVL